MRNILRHKNIWSYLAIFFFLLVLLISNPSVRIVVKTSLADLFKIPSFIGSFLLNELKALVSYRINLDENTALKKEVGKLKSDLIQADEARLENARLKNLLSLKSSTAYPSVAAYVIGRDASNWSNSLLIDKGSKTRIKTGMAVISPQGLVGRIQETGKFTSKVLLITDPNFSVAAIDMRSRETGIISGTLSASLLMRYLDADSDIQVGDLIISSQISSFVPAGLPIGEVAAISRDPAGMGVSARLKPAASLNTLEEVLVILESP